MGLFTAYNIRIEKIFFLTINYQMITGFLDWLETDRRCTAKTINHRLSCIRSFYKYVTKLHPILTVYFLDIDKCRLVLYMSLKKQIFFEENPIKSTFFLKNGQI